MLELDLKHLPTSEELPCSDDTPVDNVDRRTWRSQDQNLLPNVLLFLLTAIWSTRMDWYFGVDMTVYHTTGENPRIPVVPDAFLSLNVERKKGGKSRRSYVVWEEGGVVPIMTLEMVSHKPGGEYSEKMEIYARLGVLYYLIYNPEFGRRDKHEPFEMYKLIDGEYQLQHGEPYWMPEIGLGIGRDQTSFGNLPQEQLAWFDERGDRYLSEAEVERQQKEAERQRREQLEAFLRSQGFDPNHLPEP